MPIRFRCAYCNQLLGISRRKAGQVVRCPTCAGQVVVPQPEDGAADDAPPRPAGETSAATGPPVFERSDFDELFQAPVAPAPAAAPPAPAQEEFFDVEPIGPPPARVPTSAPPVAEPERLPAGIVLSPARATILTVLAIIAVALAFGVGLVVGLSLRGTPPAAPATVPTGHLEGLLPPPDAGPAYG